MSNLGRRVPTDFKHVRKYSFAALAPEIPFTVEKVLRLPLWHWSHDQGEEGACVGFGATMETAIRNILQARAGGVRPFNRYYDSHWLYKKAQDIDEWSDTPPEEGTSVRAAYDILRTVGHRLRTREGFSEPNLGEGISENRWATTVDEMRASIAADAPMAIGINWYSAFDHPQQTDTGWFASLGLLGTIRGGHCVCIYGASDKRQAFKFKNSWGTRYPLCWLSYVHMQRLIDEQGEVALVTDYIAA